MPKRGIAGVECPECGSIRTRTVDTGYSDQGFRLRRRRCTDCEAPSFTTVEIPVGVPFGSLDTSRRTLQREYARKKYGYLGRVDLAHWRPAHLLQIDVKVITHDPNRNSTTRTGRSNVPASATPSLKEDLGLQERHGSSAGNRGSPVEGD